VGNVKGKVKVTVYIPEAAWEKIRRLAPVLPTGRKNVSGLLEKLIDLGLRYYAPEEAQETQRMPAKAAEPEKKREGEEVYEVVVDGVKLFLRPIG